jgi:hypothetical protein
MVKMTNRKNLHKKSKKWGKIGTAAGELASRLVDPKNQYKFLSDAASGKGFILPGSKYIGPGNSLDLGTPLSSDDAAAMKHDYAYDRLLKQGVKPTRLYLGYSDADKVLLKETNFTTPEGIAIQLGIGAKKLAYKAGLTGGMIREKKNKYIRGWRSR